MAQSAEAPSHPPALELVRQFVNTLEVETGADELATCAGAIAWLEGRGLVPSTARITEAQRAKLVEVREALRALLLANNGAELDHEAIGVLNRTGRDAPLALEVTGTGGSLVPAVEGVRGAIAAILAAVSTAMAAGSWPRLKACRDDACRWAFVDGSRNRSGHWCSMAVCGNRAKARNYRQRQKS